MPTGGADSQKFGMSRRVSKPFDPIPTGRQDLSAVGLDDHGSHRNLTQGCRRFGFGEGVRHE